MLKQVYFEAKLSISLQQKVGTNISIDIPSIIETRSQLNQHGYSRIKISVTRGVRCPIHLQSGHRTRSLWCHRGKYSQEESCIYTLYICMLFTQLSSEIYSPALVYLQHLFQLLQQSDQLDSLALAGQLLWQQSKRFKRRRWKIYEGYKSEKQITMSR